jgi:hypothetical protein
MKFRSLFVSLAAAPLLLTTLSGCPGTLPPDETGTGGTAGTGTPCMPAGLTTTPPATFATVRDMFNTGMGPVSSCVSAPCHGDNGQAPPDKPLSLQAGPNLYKTMTTYISHRCGDMPLVNKGKPNESALIKIMEPTACGDPLFRMPFICMDEQCMPPDYMAAISAWIANCAPEN